MKKNVLNKHHIVPLGHLCPRVYDDGGIAITHSGALGIKFALRIGSPVTQKEQDGVNAYILLSMLNEYNQELNIAKCSVYKFQGFHNFIKRIFAEYSITCYNEKVIFRKCNVCINTNKPGEVLCNYYLPESEEREVLNILVDLHQQRANT